jgi:hypothetical protein
VSERIINLDKETENCLLINPEKSILGFAAVRMELESFIAIKIQDKTRRLVHIIANGIGMARFGDKLYLIEKLEIDGIDI